MDWNFCLIRTIKKLLQVRLSIFLVSLHLSLVKPRLGSLALQKNKSLCIPLVEHYQVNPKVQEAIDTMVDQKAELSKQYEQVKQHLTTDPAYALPILFDIEEEIDLINEKYQLLMGYINRA